VPQNPQARPRSPDARKTRSEARREAAPLAVALLAVYVVLAGVSWAEGWTLMGFPWWAWLIVAGPAALLALDLLLAWRGTAVVRSRGAAVAFLGVLVSGNAVALGILVAGLVTTSTKDLSGVELLLTGFAIWSADVIVFGLLFWEVDAGGPLRRMLAESRRATDFRFPQDEDPEGTWRPQVWDYLYVSLTNSIAFSPTDTMPLSLRAKALMGAESAISAATVLLVAARAVNVLGS
jgi:uncharacterized membrane protein